MARAKASGMIELPPLEGGECYVCQRVVPDQVLEFPRLPACTWADDDHTLCSVCRDIGTAFLEWLVAHIYSRKPEVR